jgi:hypothetical protein
VNVVGDIRAVGGGWFAQGVHDEPLQRPGIGHVPRQAVRGPKPQSSVFGFESIICPFHRQAVGLAVIPESMTVEAADAQRAADPQVAARILDQVENFAVAHQAVGDGVRLHRQVFRAEAGG